LLDLKHPGVLRVARKLPPLQALITRQLTGGSPEPGPH
jgi:hypothetical protein